VAENKASVRYRKIPGSIWADERVNSLSSDGLLLYLWLRSGPATTNIPGLVPVSKGAAADYLRLPMEKIDQAFSELEDSGLAKADWYFRLVWLPDSIVDDPPSAPNVVTGWRDSLFMMPNCDLKLEAIASIRKHIYQISDSYGEALDKVLTEARLNTAFQNDLEDSDPPSEANTESIRDENQESDESIPNGNDENEKSIRDGNQENDNSIPNPGTGAGTGEEAGTGAGKRKEKEKDKDKSSSAPSASPSSPDGLCPSRASPPTKPEIQKAKAIEKLDQNIQLAKEIQQVYRHYLKSTGMTEETYVLTPHRLDKIRFALRHWDADTVCVAIDACMASEFHAGEFDDLADHILASYEKIEGWLNKRAKQLRKEGGNSGTEKIRVRSLPGPRAANASR